MTTNRAFIKAYRHDTAQPTPTAPALAGTARQAAAAVSATIQFVAAATDFDSTASAQQSGFVAPVAGSIDVLPPSAQPFVGITHIFDEEHELQESAASPRPLAGRTNRSAGAKRPLSAYIARQRAEQTAAINPTKDNTFRPGTIVASFRWPAVSRTLSQRCRTELDGVGDLLLTQAEQERSMIGLVGLFPGGGLTTTLLALAARLAIRKRRTLLVDGNFRKPQLAASLDVVPTAGWQEVLADAAPLHDAVIRAADDCLDLLALGAKTPDAPLRLVAGHEIEACGRTIRGNYDLALIDLGAFFDTRSKPIMLELARNMGVDAVLAVVGPDETDARDLSTVAEHFRRSGCELLGRIENRVANT